jgi:LEA14-like dessication related protein
MKKTYIVIGLGALALFLASKVGKYKTFWDKLSFSVSKVRLRAPFPYSQFEIIITTEAYNPTTTTASLNGASGMLYMQGKPIANLKSGSVAIKQGKNYFDVTATITIEQLNAIIMNKYNTSNIANFVKQLANEPFETDMTYYTSLGTFTSKDTWRISEFA